MQPARGTFDLLGDDILRYRHIQNVAYEQASLYGYHEILTPIFEQTAVFLKPLGESSDIVGKEMYTFIDKGGESVTLRPEGTAPVMRALLSNGLTQTLPQRFITTGPFFRYERPQKGRFRQFHQVSVECIGIPTFYADVEILCLAHSILKALGINDIALCLNTLGDQQSRAHYRQALTDYFTKYRADLSRDSQIRLDKNPLRILDSKDDKDQAIVKDAPVIHDYLNPESRDFFDNVCRLLDKMAIPFVLEPTLVRGLDYYCHTVFEFKSTSLGAQNTVLGGGRYDGLMSMMGGPSIPAVGFAMGMERLALILENVMIEAKKPVLSLIPMEDAASVEFCVMLAETLRAQGIYSEVLLAGKIAKRLAAAHKKGTLFTSIVGTNEVTEKQIQLKQGEQNHSVHIAEIPTFLKNPLS